MLGEKTLKYCLYSTERQTQRSVTKMWQKACTCERNPTQRRVPADVQMQSQIFSAKVVSNCSQAIQVCLSEWIIYKGNTVVLSPLLSLHNNEGKSLWWKLLLHGDVTNTGQKFTTRARTRARKEREEAFERTACWRAELLNKRHSLSVKSTEASYHRYIGVFDRSFKGYFLSRLVEKGKNTCW